MKVWFAPPKPHIPHWLSNWLYFSVLQAYWIYVCSLLNYNRSVPVFLVLITVAQEMSDFYFLLVFPESWTLVKSLVAFSLLLQTQEQQVALLTNAFILLTLLMNIWLSHVVQRLKLNICFDIHMQWTFVLLFTLHLVECVALNKKKNLIDISVRFLLLNNLISIMIYFSLWCADYMGSILYPDAARKSVM